MDHERFGNEPRRAGAGRDLTAILWVLAGWGGATFGFQILLRLIGEPPHGDSILTRLTFFTLPFHFWFTGQFLPLWFIILCVLFNLHADRAALRESRRRDHER